MISKALQSGVLRSDTPPDRDVFCVGEPPQR